MIDKLQEKGARVDVIFSGCGPEKVYDQTIIKAVGFYKGFTFTIKNGRIDFINTAAKASPGRFIRDVCKINTRDYDLVITDFEPITAYAAGKNRLPSIGIGHQYAFSYKIPMKKHNPFARLILAYFAPAAYTIGLHWHHFNQPILPPIIPKTVKACSNENDQLILVYLPFEDKKTIKRVLSPFNDYTFAIYAGDKTEYARVDGNITWHPFSKTQFFTDLTACSGVICNAGFELPSEALNLGKKLLVKPLTYQFEQHCNALALSQLNLGTVTPQLDKTIVKTWLKQPFGPQMNYPDVSEHISRWVIQGDWSKTSGLVKDCWS